jgi:hypothetical protein
MPKLTEQVAGLAKRVDALETKDLDENAILLAITKVIMTLETEGTYCSEATYCSESTYCGEDVDGLLDYLNDDLDYIGLGTGASPAFGDDSLASEVSRQAVSDSLIDGNTLIKQAEWGTTDGNGSTYTNTGIFGVGATVSTGTGTMFCGGAVNSIEKTSGKQLTVQFEITIQEAS